MRKKNVFIFANAKVSQFASENVSNRPYKAVLSTFWHNAKTFAVLSYNITQYKGGEAHRRAANVFVTP